MSVSVSLPSTTASSSNFTVNRFSVSSGAKVTLAGTASCSSAPRFSPRVATIGTVTSRSGAWLSRTVTAANVPSVTAAAAAPNVTETIGTSSSTTVSSSAAGVPGT